MDEKALERERLKVIDNANAETLGSVIKNLAKSFMLSPSSVQVCLGLSLFLLIIAIVLIGVLNEKGYVDIVASYSHTNPLNQDMMTFNLSKDHYLIQKYYYSFVFGIVVVAFLLAILAIYYIVKNKNNDITTPMTITIFTGLFAMYLLWVIITSIIAYLWITNRLRMVYNSITGYNNFVYNRMYLKTSFLKTIQEPASSGILIDSQIQQAMLTFCNDAPPKTTNPNAVVKDIRTPENLVRVIFSVNYYYNLHKLGLDNPILYKATSSLFSPYSIFRKSSSPANYLYYNGMLIEDRGETWWTMVSRECKDAIIKNIRSDKERMKKLNIRSPAEITDTFIKMFILSNISDQIAGLNNRSNSIRTSSALWSYILFSLAMFIIYLIPLFIYRRLKPETKNKILKLLESLTGLEIPAIPTTQGTNGTKIEPEREKELTGKLGQLYGKLKTINKTMRGGKELLNNEMPNKQKKQIHTLLKKASKEGVKTYNDVQMLLRKMYGSQYGGAFDFKDLAAKAAVMAKEQGQKAAEKAAIMVKEQGQQFKEAAEQKINNMGTSTTSSALEAPTPEAPVAESEAPAPVAESEAPAPAAESGEPAAESGEPAPIAEPAGQSIEEALEEATEAEAEAKEALKTADKDSEELGKQPPVSGGGLFTSKKTEEAEKSKLLLDIFNISKETIETTTMAIQQIKTTNQLPNIMDNLDINNRKLQEIQKSVKEYFKNDNIDVLFTQYQQVINDIRLLQNQPTKMVSLIGKLTTLLRTSTQMIKIADANMNGSISGTSETAPTPENAKAICDEFAKVYHELYPEKTIAC